MKIVVYTKSNCPNCVSAKQLLKSKSLEYKEICLDNEAERAAFTVMFPDLRQMPQIFINSQRVGGFAGLQAALEQV
jgi:glutaredoxin 3